MGNRLLQKPTKTTSHWAASNRTRAAFYKIVKHIENLFGISCTCVSIEWTIGGKGGCTYPLHCQKDQGPSTLPLPVKGPRPKPYGAWTSL